MLFCNSPLNNFPFFSDLTFICLFSFMYFTAESWGIYFACTTQNNASYKIQFFFSRYGIYCIKRS